MLNFESLYGFYCIINENSIFSSTKRLIVAQSSIPLQGPMWFRLEQTLAFISIVVFPVLLTFG